MKQIITGLATLLAVCLSSCSFKGTDSSDKYLCGAYADYRVLTEEDSRLFESTYTYELKLTPQSVATQVVAGTNYRFICTDKSDHDVQVVIFKPLPHQGKPKVTSIELVSGKDSSEIVAILAQIMYDDILSLYDGNPDGQQKAYHKYASDRLQHLLNEVDNSITQGEIDPMVYGWDCDPWIMAQDYNHPTATVIKVHGFTDQTCKADVEINDSGMRSKATLITLSLVKENNAWKVDDFTSPETSAKTFANQLKEEYETAKSHK